MSHINLTFFCCCVFFSLPSLLSLLIHLSGVIHGGCKRAAFFCHSMFTLMNGIRSHSNHMTCEGPHGEGNHHVKNPKKREQMGQLGLVQRTMFVRHLSPGSRTEL
ncbi:MAG: hypothetical protein JOS17DRAFT_491788 [Linnemannia elongata]|nr:MAG: hypothetical protein JOS17DRAFT_491788 [Linnemannia elongata]